VACRLIASAGAPDAMSRAEISQDSRAQTKTSY
jgi:hypothetical protein